MLASFFDPLVAECDAFRIVLEPLIGKVWRRKHLEVIDVADFLAGIDIDPNSCPGSLLGVRRLKFVKSFIKLARFLLCFEECVSSGSLLLHLWCSRRRCGGTLTSCRDLPNHCRR
jgi:hypothetical protein